MSDFYQEIADENNISRSEEKRLSFSYLYGSKKYTKKEIKKSIRNF